MRIVDPSRSRHHHRRMRHPQWPPVGWRLVWVSRYTAGVQIPYLVRNGLFLEPCTRAIEDQRGALIAGSAIRIKLKSGGYPGRVVVVLKLADRCEFDADWLHDPTRFPQRIRAAVTALRDCGESGRFDVVHDDGLIEIRRLGS